MGLVHPEDSLIRLAVCNSHYVMKSDYIHQSRFQSPDADTLVFAIVPGIETTGGNFNGAYSMDQDGELKKRGYFEETLYLTGAGVKRSFPNSFKSLLTGIEDSPKELAIYKMAIKRFQASFTIADYDIDLYRTQKEFDRIEAAKKERIREAEQLEQRYQLHVELIRSAAENAFANQTVSLEMAHQLVATGLMKPSTERRRYYHFPGEDTFIWYDFTKEGTRHAGYIGFDSDLRLISIDERYPTKNLIYIK